MSFIRRSTRIQTIEKWNCLCLAILPKRLVRLGAYKIVSVADTRVHCCNTRIAYFGRTYLDRDSSSKKSVYNGVSPLHNIDTYMKFQYEYYYK